MIEIDVYRNGSDMLTGYRVSGHALPAGSGEGSLVCNSVSVLTQVPVLGLERYLKRSPSYKVNEEEGLLEVALTGAPDELSQVLLMSMLCGLEDLAQAYPHHIRIRKHRR